jgi:hypothetical protein
MRLPDPAPSGAAEDVVLGEPLYVVVGESRCRNR